MYRFRLFLIVILIFQVCHSQNFSLNKGETKAKDYYTEITFEYIKSKIIIPVIIEGKTYRFILDTGAPNIISENLFRTIQNDSLSTIPITDINQKKKQLKVVAIPKLILGDVTFENSAALVYDINQNKIFECFKIDGFIGSNLLRNSIIQIQLENKLIKLTDNKKRLILKKKNALKMKLLGIQSNPFIWINFKGTNTAKEQVLIDTGMDGFYNMSNKNFKVFENKNLIKIIDSSSGGSSVGLFGLDKKSNQYRFLLPKIKISNITFNNFITKSTNDKYSKIGTEILDYGDIIIDYINKRFYLDSFHEEINLKKKMLGFNPTLIDNKVVVGFVWSEELKKRISFGDEIIEVNGLKLSDIDLCNFLVIDNTFREMEKFNLIIKTQNGETIELNIEKKYFPNSLYLQKL